MDKLLKESPFSLVKFQVYSKREEMKFNDRRLNRVRNKNRIPFGPWARTVADSTYAIVTLLSKYVFKKSHPC